MEGLPEVMDTDLVDGDLYDRLHGGWLGKCIGAILGTIGSGRQTLQDLDGVVSNKGIDCTIAFLESAEAAGESLGNVKTTSAEPHSALPIACADYCGYLMPGQPAGAVALARRLGGEDCPGGLLMAAMASAAFATADVREIVSVGRDALPSDDAMSVVLSRMIDAPDQEAAEQSCRECVDSASVAEENVPIVRAAIAILSGRGDFEESITIAADGDVAAGMAVGSILGVMCESHGLPGKFRDAMNDRLESQRFLSGSARVSELARRTLDVVRRMGANP